MKKRVSLFFPLSLIAAGVLWLLIQMSLMPAANLWALTHIWPFLLIAMGLGLILRSFWEGAGLIVSTLVVVGAVLAVVFAPQLGWAGGPDWKIGSNFTGAVDGSGKIKTETRKVESFDAISIDYPAEVIVVQGKSESVKVEADDNLLPQLSTKVVDGRLVIKNKETDWSKRVEASDTIKITITVKELRDVNFTTAGKLRIEKLETDSLSVDLSGAGEVELVDMNTKSLDCTLGGAGNIKATGTADEVSVEIDGFGNFYGDDLQSLTADLTINGAGNIQLKVKTSLDAEINGAGSISYYGSPTVDRSVNGAGSISRMGD